MLKTVKTGAAAALLMLAVATPAYAELRALSAHFAGGCFSDNTGGCTIKANGTGTDLEGTAISLRHADKINGSYRTVSKPGAHKLDATGHGKFRFHNQPGCYEVTDGHKIRSRQICEK